MITVNCPRCSAELEYGDEAQGQVVKCPECKRPFEVMGMPSPEPTGPVKPMLQTAMLIGGGLVFIVASIGAIIGLIAIRNNPKPIQQALGRMGDFISSSVASLTGLLMAIVAAVLVIGYIVAVFAATSWVARDAHNRRHNALGWALFYLAWQLSVVSVATPLLPFCGLGLVVLPFGWIGLLIYLGGRSQGPLAVCGRCSNKRLKFALSCPHCGGSDGVGVRLEKA